MKQEAQGGPQEVPTEPKKFVLNSSEELYAELRDKNFNAVGPTLSRKAKLITAQFDVSVVLKSLREIQTYKTSQLEKLEIKCRRII